MPDPAEVGPAVVGYLLMGQAALLCWLEELLYAGEGRANCVSYNRGVCITGRALALL